MTDISSLLEKTGITVAASCGISVADPFILNRQKLESIGFEPVSVLFALFPYMPGCVYKGFSAYSCVPDYHHEIVRIFVPVISRIENDGFRAHVFADDSPFDEVKCAEMLELGSFGRNRLLLNRVFGTKFFIGELVSNMQLTGRIGPAAPAGNECADCGACINSCPTGSLLSGDISACLSSVTQWKGELTSAEIALMREYNCVWGCDICQNVCPANDGCFEPLITGTVKPPPIETLSGSSNRDFLKKYKNAAWSWRGKNVLLRNMKIVNGE